MFTPPVGRCSVLVCDGLFLCNYYSQEKTNVFGFFGVCTEKLLENIFGIDSLTEIVFFKITCRVAGEKNESLFSS